VLSRDGASPAGPPLRRNSRIEEFAPDMVMRTGSVRMGVHALHRCIITKEPNMRTTTPREHHREAVT
jgi:hypothetical protein